MLTSTPLYASSLSPRLAARHWPVGLLYDHTTSNLAPTAVDGARHSRGSRGSGQDWSQSHSSQPRPPLPPPAPVPWSIILHIKNLPHAKLPPLSSNSTAPPTAPALDAIGTCLEAVKQSYMASLKEADFVRNGNTKKVNALRKSDQDGIWEAVQRGDFALYSSVMVKILPPASTYDAGAGAGDATTSASAPPAFDPPQPAPTPPPPTPPPPPSSSSMVPSRGSSLLPPGRNASSTSLLTPGVNTVGLGSSGNEQQHADAAAASEASASASTSTTPTPASVPPPGTLRGTGLPGLKSIPMRFILQGGTILQEGVPPIGEDGRPMTLGVVLHTLFPALFPVAATAATTGATPSFSLGLDFMASDVGAGAGADAGGSTATAAPAPAAPPSISHIDPLAVPIMQGIRVPLASTMLYLNRCLAGADGWVTVVLLLLPVGDSAQ